MATHDNGGPRPARRLLIRVFPEPEGRAAASDLDEEYTTSIRPGRGRIRADLWYWDRFFGPYRTAGGWLAGRRIEDTAELRHVPGGRE